MYTSKEAYNYVCTKYNYGHSYNVFFQKFDSLGFVERDNNSASGKKTHISKIDLDQYFKFLDNFKNLKLVDISKKNKIPYYRLYYISMKYNIELIKKYNTLCFKNEKERDYVIKLSRKSKKVN